MIFLHEARGRQDSHLLGENEGSYWAFWYDEVILITNRYLFSCVYAKTIFIYIYF